MYRRGDATRVRVDSLAAHLCGPFRPGHFEGVATVVSKLFGVIGECAAVFGEKDWQQLAIIRRFVADLFLPVTVLSQPTVREKDGLALSSRNAFLSPSERSRALSIASGLGAASTAWKAGERNAEALAALVVLDADSTDYVAVVDPESLVPLRGAIGGKALIAVACRIGKTRLIDNVVVSSPSAR